MKVFGHGPAQRIDRPATELMHDEANARVVMFHLGADQSVAPHTSESTVLVHVVSGRGRFTGESGHAILETGEGAVYAPGEMHGMEAIDGPLKFIATITPRPGT